MTLLGLATRNLWRNRPRTIATVLAVAVTVVCVVLIRTAISAWSLGADRAPRNRLLTRNGVAYELGLPRTYVEAIRAIPGVRAVSWLSWFGAKDPRHESFGISSYACDPASFLALYDGIAVSSKDSAHWIDDRTGALVGSALAARMGWKVGDRVVLSGTFYPGNWELTIDAIYTPTGPVADPGLLLLHWDYVNGAAPHSPMHDRVEYVWTSVADAGAAAAIAQAIDRRFEGDDAATKTEDEHTFFASMLGMVSTALRALDIVSVVVFFIMALLMWNTTSMAVDERLVEYAATRAIGFGRCDIWTVILAESAMINLCAAVIGLLVAYPVVDLAIGRWVETNMAALMPEFRMQLGSAVGVALVCLALGALTALPHSIRVTAADVARDLRRVG
jgi:putative ABC transport system permease protein